ncbi:MAG: AI-2E family transporter [Gammaproteobacteria bacterium]
MAILRSKAAASAIIGIYRLLLFIFVMCVLYFGQSLLVPLTVAGLLAFLLSPLAKIFEKWLGRIAGIFIVLIMFLITLSIIIYVLTNQIVEFTNELPIYRVNIESRLNSFNISQNSGLTKILDEVEKLKSYLPGQNNLPKTSVRNAAPINIVETTSFDLISIIKHILGSLADIIGMTGLILLLMTFMLFNREDIRGRFIRLIGSRRLGRTTRAINDASERVFHFLFMKLLINIFFGIVIAIGLYFIGIPNPILWGGFAALLRFIPYLGVVIAAVIPCLLALAISENWIAPILTIGLFGLLDFIASNIMEPLLFSSRTGISSLALIVSAVFWFLLWGPIGLLLSIPLTVCIVVMGRHIPSLEFLSIILSDEEALPLHQEYYQRLIAVELPEATHLINNYLKSNSLVNLYDSIYIPILGSAQTDHQKEFIDDDQLAYFYLNIQDILEETHNHFEAKKVSVQSSEDKQSLSALPEYKVLCIPAGSEPDALASIMLAQLLKDRFFAVETLMENIKMDEIINYVEKNNYDAVCISLVAPAPLMKARILFMLLHRRFPQLKIILGLWGDYEITTEMQEKLKALGIYSIVLLLSQAIDQLEKLRQTQLE